MCCITKKKYSKLQFSLLAESAFGKISCSVQEHLSFLKGITHKKPHELILQHLFCQIISHKHKEKTNTTSLSKLLMLLMCLGQFFSCVFTVYLVITSQKQLKRSWRGMFLQSNISLQPASQEYYLTPRCCPTYFIIFEWRGLRKWTAMVDRRMMPGEFSWRWTVEVRNCMRSWPSWYVCSWKKCHTSGF